VLDAYSARYFGGNPFMNSVVNLRWAKSTLYPLHGS
jgi:hypothetical protein